MHIPIWSIVSKCILLNFVFCKHKSVVGKDNQITTIQLTVKNCSKVSTILLLSWDLPKGSEENHKNLSLQV